MISEISVYQILALPLKTSQNHQFNHKRGYLQFQKRVIFENCQNVKNDIKLKLMLFD